MNYSDAFLKELEAETPASRKCVERIPETLFGWKPHEKSMALGYLTLLVAEILRWIQVALEDNEIDFATFKHFQPKNTAELVANFDENVKKAKNALRAANDETFSKHFELKRNGELLFKVPMVANISSTINHWVHHRGQLTVYMRLNNIAVPSIYGPSADERTF
ncbi:MAG: DinB family protein [Chitinophagaceae bacterium]